MILFLTKCFYLNKNKVIIPNLCSYINHYFYNEKERESFWVLPEDYKFIFVCEINTNPLQLRLCLDLSRNLQIGTFTITFCFPRERKIGNRKNQWIEKWIQLTFLILSAQIEFLLFNLPGGCKLICFSKIKLAVVVYNIKNELANVGELTNNQIRIWMVSELRYLGKLSSISLNWLGSSEHNNLVCI